MLDCILWILLATGVPQAGPPDGTILSREPIALGSDAAPASVEASTGVRLERIVYASDGLEVEGFLAMPAVDPRSPLPCVIYNRGGNREFGALDPARAAARLGRLAQRGYVVVASNYRGNSEVGRRMYPPLRTCPDGEAIGGRGREEFGGAEVHDVLALIMLLESLPQADAQRLGIFGWSRGGMMTYLALKASNRFRAAIVGGGLSDMDPSREGRPEMIEHVYAELIPGWDDVQRRPAAIEARSAVRWAERLPATTPILLLHGTADWRVPPAQTLAMAQALLVAQRPYRLVMFEGGDHGLSEHREEVDRLVDQWLDHYVRDGGTYPSLEPHGP